MKILIPLTLFATLTGIIHSKTPEVLSKTTRGTPVG